MFIKDYPNYPSPSDDDLLLIWESVTNSTKQIKLAELKTYFGIKTTSPAPVGREVTLDYQFDGDTNGVFYYLGTDGLSQSWVNPHVSNKILVRFSAPYNDEHNNPHFLVDREPNSLIATSNVAYSYMAVDLLANKKLLITAYSVRGRSVVGENLRNWKLQASNDFVDWIDINTQTDRQLTTNQWASAFVATQSVSYRYFRILQTSTNNNGSNIMCLGELELYGKLLFTE